MSKVVLIGIDGMDYELIHQWKDELPTFSQMIKTEKFFSLESVFPPDSVPAWITIYTGLNPMEHGMLHHINYFSKGSVRINTDSFKGKTFWDVAGKRGKKVCIINPFLAYPVWPINGVMINGPSFVKGAIQSFPETVLENNTLPRLGGHSDFPTRENFKDFIHKNHEDIRNIKDFAIKLFKTDVYDLCFITFLNLDRIKHFLWRYYDENDPTYPGKNQFSNAIKDYYILFDKVINEFQRLFPESIIMVISDHGHGRRCTSVVNLNEFLRKKDYLFSKGNKVPWLNYKYLTEKTKNFVLNLFDKYDMEDILYKITPYIPYKKALKDSSFLINPSENLAEVDTNIGGVNPFGGIRINKSKLKKLNIEYEDFRKKLISELAELNDNKKNDLFKWIDRREALYSGKYTELYPDILFELNPDYGVSPSLHTKVFSKSTTHKKISGGHKRYGILGLSNVPYSTNTKTPTLLQIAPTVLDLMNCYQVSDYKTSSILKKDTD